MSRISFFIGSLAAGLSKARQRHLASSVGPRNERSAAYRRPSRLMTGNSSTRW
jgi:hypothetical protein